MRSLALAAACVAAACAGADFPPPPPPPPGQAEVLVIGAGWAGMTAAHTLSKAGVSFQVLEARNYTGGRTHAIPFGDPSVWSGQVEAGSAWVCGCTAGATSAENPVCNFANSAGLTMHVDNYVEGAIDSSGNAADLDHKIFDASNAAVQCADALAAKKKTSDSMSVRDALTQCKWVPKTGVEKAMDWLITVDEAGMPADQQSLKMEFGAYDTVEDASSLGRRLRRAGAGKGRRLRRSKVSAPRYAGDWQFVTEQKNPRGYAAAIDEMTKDTVPPGDKRVLLNQRVTKISYSSSGVTATTAGGATYAASAAIVTIPYGVLIHEHEAMFSPALPKALRKILNGGVMVSTNETKVIIQFPTAFWDNSVNQFVAAPADGDAVGNFCEFLNLNHKDNMPGSNTLLAFLGNPESSKYEAMDDAGVQKAMLKKLATMYPNVTIPAPSAFYITRWSQDPFARGAYSGFHPGFDDDDFEALMTPPLKKVLYLAGEALCDDMSGYTHGGYQSGLESTEKYLKATGRGNKATELCWA